MNDWLNLADIHLVPQKKEAADLVLPSKVLGILASGGTMVATSSANTTLGRIAEQTGRRVNPGDAKALAKAIAELSDKEEERRALGERARKIAEENYGINSVLGRFESKALSTLEHGGTKIHNHAKNSSSPES